MLGDDDFRGSQRFRIQRRLGAGGMGVVFEAYDNERGALVALKTLRNVDAHGIYRFKSEFRALADLEHGNLVRLGELFNEGGQWFFTMEIVEGTDFLAWVCPGSTTPVSPTANTVESDPLRKLPAGRVALPVPLDMDQTARLPRFSTAFDEDRLRAALGQLAQGLAALHAAGKVHRDIKPSNILVTPAGRVVLLDFGLVTDTQGGQSTEHPVVGTAAYMAPEQAASKPVGPEADWYSVGVLLYEALTGRPPFEGRPLEVLMDKQRREPAVPETRARDLDLLCRDLLRREPADRPTGARILERLGVGGDAPAGVPPAPEGSMQTHAGRFVGRVAELAALRDALAATRVAGAGPVTVCVHGESGFGKSSLVRRFLDELEGPVVLGGRCYERESVPYKAFDGIMDAISQYLRRQDAAAVAYFLPRDAASLARVFPVLRRIPAMANVPEPRIANPQELRARAFSALRELLARLAERHPLVLFIDDFQWADSDSLGLLHEVMHAPDAPELMLLLTVRTAALPGSEALASVAGIPCAVRYLHMGPLPTEDAEALATLLLGQAGVAATEAAVIAREAEGHPMFIRELVWHLGAVGRRFPVAVKLDEAVWARVGRLEASARELLEVVAIAGAPIAQRVLPLAAGLDARECSSALSVLRAGNLVRSRGLRDVDAVEPYHDRVREAVVAHLDDATRARHHGRLVDAFESAGYAAQDPQLLVRHLEGAGRLERAAEQARRAAKLASETLAFDQAVELYRTALRLGRFDEADKRALRIALAEALVHAGRGVEAADAFLAAVDGANAATRLECQRRAAEQLLMVGHFERGIEALNAVLAEIDESLPSTPRAALMSLLWHRLKLRLRGLGWKPKDESEIAARDLTRLDVYRAVSIGLGLIDNIRGADFQARSLLLALQTGEDRRVGRAIAQEGMYVGSQGQRAMPRARRLVELAGQVAQRTGEPYLRAFHHSAVGLIAYFSCDFETATRELWTAEEVLRDETVGTMWELQSNRIFRLFVARHTGDFRELLRWVPEYVRDAARRGDRYAETTMTRVGGVLWLSQDDPGRCEAELDRQKWSPPDTGLHLQHWYELRARAELDLYLGRTAGMRERYRDRLAALEKSIMLRLELLRTEVRWVAGRLRLAEAAAGIDRAAALAEVDRLLARIRRERVPIAEVWGRLLAAGVAVQREAPARAITLLREAIALADAQKLRLCAAAARMRCGVLVGGDEGAALRAAAGTALEVEGVKSTRMIDVVAPGF